MDSGPSNKAFAEKIGVTFPLLSDWKRTVTQEYGLYDEKSQYGRRASFVLDKEGKIQHIDAGSVAIDPTGAYEVCEGLHKGKTAAPTKP